MRFFHWCTENPLHMLGLSGAEDVRVRVRCCVLARRKEGRSGRSLDGRAWMSRLLSSDKVVRSSFSTMPRNLADCRDAGWKFFLRGVYRY